MTRRRAPIWMLLAAALLTLGAAPARALTSAEARHLLVRTGFHADPAAIDALRPLDRAAAVRRVLSRNSTRPSQGLPDWADRPLGGKRLRDMTEAQRQAFRKARRDEAMDLKAWWFREMVATPSPLVEKMTLFWHNHFTSELRKVKSARAMLRQNLLLREHALGSFPRLLEAIATDTAMLIYLDGASNRKGKPNENFARELLELFTLGEGHYSEQDIKEVARAFTGWTVDQRQRWNGLQATFRPARHDTGRKEALGHAGALDGAAIIDILLQDPRTATFVVEKLWRAFVHESPEPRAVARVADRFRASGHDIGAAMQALLTEPEFWHPNTRGRLVKSPVELLVGSVRAFAMPIRDGAVLARSSRGLGQDVFDPPNVKGWEGGTAWITADSLVMRQEILGRLLRGVEMGKGGDKRAAMMRRVSMDLDGWVNALPQPWRTPDGALLLLLPIPPAENPNRSAPPAEFVSQVLMDPAYQLQ